MKRPISVILCIALLLCLYGCKRQEKESIEFPAIFYYCADSVSYDDENGVISFEIRNAEEIANDLTKLIDIYLKGPLSAQLKSTFPKNCYLTRLTQSNNSIHLVLHGNFSDISCIDLTLARVCLAKTIFDFAKVDSIQITTEGDMDTQRQSVVIKPDSIILTCDPLIASESQE